MNSLKLPIIMLIVVVALGAGVLLFGEKSYPVVTSFEECVAAGNPVMESYPEQCNTPDGKHFVNEAQQVQNPDYSSGGAAGGTFPAGECVRAGCSSQLCVEAGEASDIITTCEYRAEYACYQSARCERQQDGKCGWSQTPELQQCLAHPPALE